MTESPDLSGLRPASLKPPADKAPRDAARLVAMVQELHKAGYQRLRIAPAMAPSGLHWRCAISHAGNVAADGRGFREAADGEIALYSSGQGTAYFGGPTAAG